MVAKSSAMKDFCVKSRREWYVDEQIADVGTGTDHCVWRGSVYPGPRGAASSSFGVVVVCDHVIGLALNV